MELAFFIVVAFSGILAPYLHLVMGQWADRIGMVRLDFARVIGNLTYGGSFEGEAPYWAGQIAVFFNGVLLDHSPIKSGLRSRGRLAEPDCGLNGLREHFRSVGVFLYRFGHGHHVFDFGFVGDAD